MATTRRVRPVHTAHAPAHDDQQRAVIAARRPARQDPWLHSHSAGPRRARPPTTARGAASRRSRDRALWAGRRRPPHARACMAGRRAVSDEAGGEPDIDVDDARRVVRPHAHERTRAQAPPRGASHFFLGLTRSSHLFA